MNVIVDAQLPVRLCEFLTSKGVNVVHTSQLPLKNKTSDTEIVRIAQSQNRIVITKDSDFWDNYILTGQPEKLLIVSTGNIGNSALIQIFERNLETIQTLFTYNNVVEINADEIMVHF